jgi:DNA-binding transcriptional LysR family regulator
VTADFTLVQLRYFVAAAECGTISAAALRVHTSQSAVSAAVQRLERELGCALFVRRPARGIALTPEGRRVLVDARALLARADALQRLGRELRDGAHGELHAGCFVTLAPSYVPRLVTRLRARHPGLVLRVHEGDGAGIARDLRSGRCEAGLTYDLDLDPDLAFDPVDEVLPYALVPRTHPVAGRAAASLRELAVTPFVLLDLPETSRYMLAMLRGAGAVPPEVLRVDGVETVRGLVAAGAGFAVLSRRAAPGADDGAVRAVEIVGATPVRIGVLRLPGPVHPRVAAFVEGCRAVAVELGGGAVTRDP